MKLESMIMNGILTLFAKASFGYFYFTIYFHHRNGYTGL